MDLTYVPFRQIVDELVNALGLRRVLTLRLVNSTLKKGHRKYDDADLRARFNHEILDVILTRQLIAKRRRVPFPYIKRPIMSKLLLKRVDNPSINDNLLILVIRELAEMTSNIPHEVLKLSKSGIKYLLCTAAVCHLGSLKAAQLMASESYDQTQTINVLNHLLTATALLGSLERLDVLFSQGALVNSVSEYFGTPLQAAAGQGHQEMVLYLLKQGADVNFLCGDDVLFRSEAYREEGSALRSATRRNHNLVVRLLLDPVHGLKTSGADCENAIMDAAYAGHTEMVRLLLERGNFTNQMELQYEILWSACRYGHIQLVQIMLDKGLDVNATKLGGSRALESAAYYGHASIVSLLFDNGAYLNYGGYECHAIHVAASNGHQEVVQMLLDQGADINSSGSRGVTPIWEAAKNQQLDMMRFLLNNGADLQADECGDYALFRAVIQGHEQVIRILAESGVRVDGSPDDTQPPPILNAMIHGRGNMVKLLLELGAQQVDPLDSAWAKKFLNGTYPLPTSPQPLLRE